MSRTRVNGFTLIELMITLAILAILAVIAIPSYTGYVKRGKLAEGTGTLSNLYLDMQQDYQDQRQYDDDGDDDPTTGGCQVTPALVATDNFTYSCTAANKTFTLTATSNANLGNAGDYTYTIDQDGTRQTSKYEGTTYNPPKSCWLIKGTEC